MENFKEKWSKLSIESKKKEYQRILDKFPTHIPTIIFNDADISLDKNKFLINKDMSIGQFMFILRKRIKLNKEEALFLLVNNRTVSISDIISSVYDQNKDESGFLIFNLSKEATFGY